MSMGLNVALPTGQVIAPQQIGDENYSARSRKKLGSFNAKSEVAVENVSVATAYF